MNKTIFTLVTLALALATTTAFAQVGIGTTNPDDSAILELKSTDKGFLPPRMSETEKGDITNPATGLTIYNTDDNCLEFYNGVRWINTCTTIGPTDVYNPETGQVWMDRNLGASQVATAFDDAASYGDLYWSVYICCDKIIQPEMFKFELWQRSMKMNLRF